jgi:L-lysine 2,3-aminomutase
MRRTSRGRPPRRGTEMTRTAFAHYTRESIHEVAQFRALPPALRRSVLAASVVLPFRVNAYVLEHLVDWAAAPDDPYFQLTFPQLDMLPAATAAAVAPLWDRPSTDPVVGRAAAAARAELNPHPADQWALNVPATGDGLLRGVQHKYPSTVLFFPAAGQTCHAYCTYCFRWPQFTGDPELRFAERDVGTLLTYLRGRTQVTDVLMTGGDPLVMHASLLRRYIAPLLAPEFAHVRVIRLGTKSLGYWPHRFLTDADTGELLRLFDEVAAAGRQLAVMSHFTHPRELGQPHTRRAIRAVQRTGAVIHSQEPIVRGVNDSADTWAELWTAEVSLGVVPYYAFVLRNTGPKRYFDVPLARCLAIMQAARRRLSGLAQTARGPVMSASPGKVLVESAPVINGQQVFALRFLQARNPAWIDRPFFAEFDDSASWLDDLRPAFAEREHFFEAEFRQLHEAARPRLELLTTSAPLG